MKKTTILILLLTFAVAGITNAADPNLVGWWTFDEGSETIAHDSAGSNNGTIHGATWTTGQTGGALSFNGVNNYVEIPDSLSLRPSYITMSAWVKPQASIGYRQIIGKSDYLGSTSEQYGITLSPNGLTFASIKRNSGCIEEQGWYNTYSQTAFQVNQWYLLTYTWDGNISKIYVNGALESSNNSVPLGTIDNCSGGTLRIGLWSASHPQWFHGMIDDVRIYNRALSGNEIMQLYEGDQNNVPGGIDLAVAKIDAAIAEKEDALQKIKAAIGNEANAIDALNDVLKSRDFGNLNRRDIITALQKIRTAKLFEHTCQRTVDKSIDILQDTLETLGVKPQPPKDSNLVAHWTFDEGSETIAHDSAGSNNGTIHGATWTTGQTGGALSFNGVNNYVEIPDSLSLRPSYITMSAWVKPQASIGYRQIIGKSDYLGSTSEQYGITLSPNGLTFASIKRNSGCIEEQGWYNTYSQTAFQVNQWYLLTYTWDGNISKIYVNGALESSNNSVPLGTIDNCSGGTLRIGLWSASHPQWFHGMIDDVRIYNRALSAEEVQALYQGGL